MVNDSDKRKKFQHLRPSSVRRKPFTVNRFSSLLKQQHMNYSVLILTTKPDCQALINIASTEKETLAYRKTGLQRQHSTASVTSLGIEADMAAVVAELASLQAVLNMVPPGTTYDDALVRHKRAEYRKFLLEQRKGNYGPIALVEKEYDIACIDQAIAETDAFIAAVTARKDELPA